MPYFLSIIIPVYNTEKFIRFCINSILPQLDDSVQVILVDDGSSDSSGDICDSFAKAYNGISVIHKKNGGLSDARNAGLEAARGKYVMFLDSDDAISSDAVGLIKNTEQDDPDIIKMFAREFCDETELVETGPRMASGYTYSSGKEALIDLVGAGKMQMCVPYSIYKSDLLKRAPGFKKGILHEDELWTPQVYLLAGQVAVKDAVFYFYRKGHASITHTKDKTKGSDDIITVCNELDAVYRTLKDKKGKKILQNYLCTLYLSAFVDWVDSGRKETSNRFRRSFPLKHAHSGKNVMKSALFCLSPFLYHKIHTLERK